jgi:uncharacterized repeat protein (TIGR02543 family)
MKRFPLVFLSLVILVTCTWLANSNPRVGKAAPDRTLPWWFGDEDYYYSEYECTDGMVLWVSNPVGPNMKVKATTNLGSSVLIDQTFNMVENHPDGAYKYYGEFVLEWPQELPPGSRVDLELEAYAKKSDGYGYSPITVWIGDCRVPANPQPGEIMTTYSDQPGYYNSTYVDNCAISEIEVEPVDADYNAVELIIGDLNFNMALTAAPSGYVSATLESPSGTRVQLIDQNHVPTFRLGSVCNADYDDLYASDFMLDDDSVYSLENGVRPFNRTAFAPYPGRLSAFNGEKANGTWKLETCRYDPPASVERPVVVRNGSFELTTNAWTGSSQNGLPIVYHESEPGLETLAQDGEWLARLGGEYGEASLEQILRPLPALARFDPYLRYWYQIKKGTNYYCSNDVAMIDLNGILVRRYSLCPYYPTTTWEMEEIDLTDTDYGGWQYVEESILSVSVSTDYGLDVEYPGSFYIDNVEWVFKDPGVFVECALLDFSIDTTSPVITQVAVEGVTQDQAIIRWQTDEPAGSRVVYGTVAASYPLEVQTSALVTDHAIPLTGLTPDTTYYYKVYSIDATGNAAQSPEGSFTTEADDIQYTLTVTANGSGSVEINPNKPNYQSGETVTLTAIPSSGYTFNGWSGDASGMETPIQITMNGDKSVTASFVPEEPDTYFLQTEIFGSGSIDRNPDKPAYQSGEVVTLTAVPANGYLFGGWNGDASGLGNPILITMDSNKSVGATFTPIESSNDFIYFMPSVLSN